MFLGQLRPEMFPGIGALPEPATESHVVNRGNPVAPCRLKAQRKRATRVAQLPGGASRALSDPYADKGLPWGRWLLTLLGLAVIVIIALRMVGVLR